jgi:NAD(P) transhydrogenase subunit alpha
MPSDRAALGSGGAIDPFIFRLAIFALAVIVGYYVVGAAPLPAHAADVGHQRDLLGHCGWRPLGRHRSKLAVVRAPPEFGFALTLASVNIFGGSRHRADAVHVQEKG